MKFGKLAMIMALLAGLGLVITGCGGDDNPTDPGSGSILVLDNDDAENYATSALDMVNGLVNNVPDFASGDFAQWNLAKSESDSVVWDPTQQAYIFDFDGPVFELEPPNSWTMRVGIWLQYRDVSGTPLQYPIGATEMEMDYSTGMSMHMEEDGSVADLDYDMDTNLTVSYLGEGDVYGIEGTGSTTVEVSQSAGGQSEAGQFAMTWAIDLISTSDGCPQGTATVELQGYTMNAVYDGEGTVNWTLVGPNYQASGSDYLACSQPVN